MDERFAKEEFRDDACVAISAFCSVFLSVMKSNMPAVSSLHPSLLFSPAYPELESGICECIAGWNRRCALCGDGLGV
jgi:hypothetical protein